jgi:hypothetical protein
MHLTNTEIYVYNLVTQLGNLLILIGYIVSIDRLCGPVVRVAG